MPDLKVFKFPSNNLKCNSYIFNTFFEKVLGSVAPCRVKVPFPHEKTKHGSLLTCAEHKLHPWVAYLIMPLFALANAGVYLGDMSLQSLTNPVPLGIMTGLFFGKQIGVFFTTFLLIKMGYARLPSQANWTQMYGIAALTGIGFTMAMFINFLAFTGEDAYINEAKIGILIASFASAILGYILLNFKSSRN